MIRCRPTSEPRPEAAAPIVLAAPDGALSDAASELDAATGGAIAKMLAPIGGKERKAGDVVVSTAPPTIAAPKVAVAILASDAAPREIEALGGAIANAMDGIETLWIGDAAGLGGDRGAIAAALARGIASRSWRFDRYKSETDRPSGVEALFAVDDEAAHAPVFAKIAALMEGVDFARALVAEPANALYPESFAARCEELSALGVEVETLGEAALRQAGMNALLAVAQGSARKPALSVMRWRGASDDAPWLALVGKGVCFDTGGISLKPAAGMEEMKWDMAGAGAVAGAMKALAGRKAEVNVIGVLGLVENMPSATASRPGDVVTAMNGTTIEIVNTDAEGRLVLADAITWTQRNAKPEVVVDLATLTGAVIVALGHEMAGLFANDDTLASQLEAAGEAVGEPLWRLPLTEPFKKHIESEIADIKNTGKAREAGATAGAAFVERFVEEGVLWAHIDIAGVAWSKTDKPLSRKGATGFGVRLLDAWIRERFERR